MRNPLPAEELREILAGQGFLRLYRQDQFLYVSDAPRRVSRDALSRIRHAMREKGFITQTGPSGLLLIDLQPCRWEELLGSFPDGGAEPFPDNGYWADVYALARLLKRHPSPLKRQPMDPVRAVLKRYRRRDGLPALALKLLALCAEKMRRGEPLPSSLANVLFSWLRDQKEEA